MLRIWVVDDDAQFRRTLHLGLSAHGYEVDAVADGKEALSVLAASAPDLIVLDWQLPGMNGIQTCRMLRLSSDVPVIMASGNRSDSKEAALEAGADDYLPKPFSMNQLLIRIQTVLKR